MNSSTPSSQEPTNTMGQIIGTTASGTTARQIDQDHVHIDFKSIKSVGVANIIDVVTHHINTVMNSRSHLIKFCNGGEVAFAYNSKGELIELSAKGMGLFINQNDELMFSTGVSSSQKSSAAY
jgi:hypothetical protein